MDLWESWLLAAAFLHLGFQGTVSFLVYPALVERGRRGDVSWAEVHQAHSRRIAPVVVVVYGALLLPVLVTTWRLATGPVEAGPAVAVAGAAMAFAATAVGAAPAHGRLAHGWSDDIGLRLVWADVVRLVGATTCAGGALTVAL